MPKILVLGDTHGHPDKMIEAMQAEQIDFSLQVGDFGAYLPTGNLSELPFIVLSTMIDEAFDI